MKSVLLTSDSNRMGCSIMASYKDAGGPPFDAVIVVPERVGLGFPTWIRPYVAWKFLGISGIVRWLRRKLGVKFMTRYDLYARYDLGWPIATAFGGAKLIYIDSVNSEEGITTLKSLQPDVIVSIGLPEIIKEPALSIARLGSLNLHNGRLPEYRGHFATFWEFYNRELSGGVTLHIMESKVDTGAIVESASIPIQQGCFGDVLERKKQIGGEMLARALIHVDTLGEMPPATPMSSEAKSGYYGWPKITELIKM